MDFNASSDYYVCDLSSFHSYYSQLHGWISLLVCIFGSIANILNILVLTRREMRSPTNIILTGLAIADLLVMIDYIPYVIHLYLYRRSRRDTFTYGWTIFVLFHSNFAQVTNKRTRLGMSGSIYVRGCYCFGIWLPLTRGWERKKGSFSITLVSRSLYYSRTKLEWLLITEVQVMRRLDELKFNL